MCFLDRRPLHECFVDSLQAEQFRHRLRHGVADARAPDRGAEVETRRRVNPWD